jgi:hypothetical protein
MKESFPVEIKGKTGNPTWTKGGPSPNPAGRTKGIPSLGGDLKESIFRVFYSAGGPDRLIRILNKESPKSDLAFISFVKNILIPILPKRTEYDVEHRSVTFVLSDGSQETFQNDPEDADVVDVIPKSQGEEVG